MKAYWQSTAPEVKLTPPSPEGPVFVLVKVKDLLKIRLLLGIIVGFAFTFIAWTIYIFAVISTPINDHLAKKPLISQKEISTRKKVALTFDDGPIPFRTKAVANILEQYSIPATFFFIGARIIKNEGVVEYIDSHGFEIANHSYSHNTYSFIPIIHAELSITSNLIKAIIGHYPVFYRPPYLISSHVESQDEQHFYGRRPLLLNELGLIAVGADIDPNDWSVQSKNELITTILDRVSRGGGVILLHEHAPYTEEVLPTLIEELSSRGFSFVSLSELLLDNKRDKQMLKLPYEGSKSDRRIESTFAFHKIHDSLFFNYFVIVHYISSFIYLTLWSLSAWIILRTSFLILLLAIDKLKSKFPSAQPELIVQSARKSVSVVVAAFNEEATIRATLDSVIQNDYDLIENIFVIDDGSKDGTARIIEDVAKSNSKIILKCSDHVGKVNALNSGIRLNTSDVIVTVDGDTVFAKDAIRKLMVHFNKCDNVSAVAGTIKTPCNESIIEKCQAIEYITGQNFDKQAFGLIGIVSVIPGAISAWKRDAILAGFSEETLVEDRDMTLAILQRGGRIKYEPNAVCFTETPRALLEFKNQRFRWLFGSIQCFWKYRHNLFDIKTFRLGWIIMPGIAFSFILSLIAPILEIWLALHLLFSSNLGFFVFGLFAVGLAQLSIAFFKEDKPPYRYLLFLPIKYLLYRTFFLFIALKGIFVFAKGKTPEWKTNARTTNTSAYYYSSIN